MEENIASWITIRSEGLRNSSSITLVFFSEDCQSKLDLVVEGQQMIVEKVDRLGTRMDRLDTKVDTSDVKVDVVFADLCVHRADTAVHHGVYRVK